MNKKDRTVDDPIPLSYKKLSDLSEDLIEFEKINNGSIPEKERVSLFALLKSGDDPDTEITGLYSQTVPVGFYVVRKHNNISYLAFIAVREDMRSKGIGSSVLKELRCRFLTDRFIVEFESPDNSDADVNALRRKEFYLRNGFHSTGYYSFYDETEFEIACSKETFDLEEYIGFLRYLSDKTGIRFPVPYRK